MCWTTVTRFCFSLVLTGKEKALQDFFFTLQKMRIVCPEWLVPPFSRSRKSDVATAWPTLVRAAGFLFISSCFSSAGFITFPKPVLYVICLVRGTQRVSLLGPRGKASASVRPNPAPRRDKADVSLRNRHDVPHHSYPMFVLRWHISLLFFYFFSLWLDHKGENRTPQRVRPQIKMLMYKMLWDARGLVIGCALWFWMQSKKVQFVSTTPHRLRKRLTSEWNML